MGVVSEDGVHLTDLYCGNIAVNLCYRVATAEVQLVREPNKKRRVKSPDMKKPQNVVSTRICQRNVANKINLHISEYFDILSYV